jgi:hypothetical protein
MVKRRSSSETLDEMMDTLFKSTKRILPPPAAQIENIIANLRAVIDELDRNFTSAKNLILKLARLLDETKQCERSQICRKIKETLRDKIEEGKITGKWIERCLPQEYKRIYAKREVCSLSGKVKKLEKIIIVYNKGKSVAGEDPSPCSSSTSVNSAVKHDDYAWTRSLESEEAAPHNPPLITEHEHFSAAEIKFTIPKERYEEVETVMRNGMAAAAI